MTISAFDLKKQLAFYGAYHSNPINVFIHIIFVPIILWTTQIFLSGVPLPDFVPKYTYALNEHLQFDLNFPAIVTGVYLLYYYTLEPVAAFLYTPQLTLSLLTATALSHNKQNVRYAIALHIIAWIAQFFGHGLAEKRAPALLDNIVGAFALAPFFVHLEILFMLGYRPTLHKELKNEIGKEIAKFKKAEGDRKRAKAKAA